MEITFSVRALLVFLICLLQYSPVSAVGNPQIPLAFEALTIEDGLSQGMVNDIYQDHFGFMWFATKDGLNRYDGIRFRVYKNKSSDTTSLADNYVQTIYEDSKNRLWFGTAQKGLELFDREREIFHHITLQCQENPDIQGRNITSIVEDADGNIWVGTFNGLFKLFIEQVSEEGNSGGSAIKCSVKRYFEGICHVIQTRNEQIWGFASNQFLFKIMPGTDGKDVIDTLDANTFYWQPDDITYDRTYSAIMVEDTIRNKLFFLYEFSIVEYDLKADKCTVLLKRKGPRPALPTSAIIDTDGKIWITNTGFVNVFDPVTREIKMVVSSDEKYYATAGAIRKIYKCKSGIIWLGSLGYGVLKYNVIKQKFHSVNSGSVGWMSKVDEGIVTILNNDFIRIFDQSSAKFVLSVHDSSFKKLTGINRLGKTISVTQDSSGNYWACKDYIIKYDPSRNKVDTLSGYGIFGVPIYYERDNSLWFGSRSSFSHYDITSGEITNWNYPITVYQAPYFFLQHIYRDSKGIFWLGTTNGLFRLDTSKNSWKHYVQTQNNTTSLSNNVIFSILPDPQEPAKILWIGTNGGGLNKFSIKSGQFINYTTEHGLPNDVVYGILGDAENNLWLSTNFGLSRFNPVDETFKNYDITNGLQGNEFNRNAYCKDNSGRMYFGGTNGFNHFIPEQITENKTIPNIVITDILIRNKALRYSESEFPVHLATYMSESLTIDHEDNMVTFEFASLEFSAPPRNQYQYKLEGFDAEWVNSGNTPSAIYTNLDPGEYTFKVLGSNNDGIWSTTPAIIKLIVLPPWYMTWGFRVLVLLLLTTALYSFYRYRLNQAIQIQRLRERIASDLHDEIGSTLSSIALYGEAAKKLIKGNEQAESMISKISQNTHDMMEAMSDIVWTINTHNDSIEDLVNRMRAFSVEMMETTNTEIIFDIQEELPAFSPDMEKRKNIYLIFKEAVNNSAKYSNCKKLKVTFKFTGSIFNMIIEDDGVGFNNEKVEYGNGLYNMNSRAEAIGGKITIVSLPGSGTMVNLKVQL